MKTYRDILVWQKAMALVTKCYIITRQFPKEELFALSSQIKRCSVSIPSNIAEGFGRGSNKDYYRFLNIALGSLFEFQTQIEIAYNLGFINEIDFNSIYDDSREIERMLVPFMAKIKAIIT
jgi:four helix bundle protein